MRKIRSRQTVLGSDSGSDYKNSRPAPAPIEVFDARLRLQLRLQVQCFPSGSGSVYKRSRLLRAGLESVGSVAGAAHLYT
ncbi:unnamed protein product [Didymodactylos carnosus]|uniref:Uncharacterized protein n=1 Tax=Didymodactylos carnosus TaxID=1234261 RepID=A0A813YX92_9BILA|nr:unnamed protein product [Didymodactylos carnosus]CAF3674551.1 unnamed protein product [Didymodactylos carnosus]